MENNIPAGVTDPADEPEVRMKACPACKGEGQIPGQDGLSDCEDCFCTGKIPMTPEEISNEKEAKKENQSEL